MVPSETTSTKAWKLCTVCINYSLNKEVRGRNKMCIDEKKLRFILSDYDVKGRKSSPT